MKNFIFTTTAIIALSAGSAMAGSLSDPIIESPVGVVSNLAYTCESGNRYWAVFAGWGIKCAPNPGYDDKSYERKGDDTERDDGSETFYNDGTGLFYNESPASNERKGDSPEHGDGSETFFNDGTGLFYKEETIRNDGTGLFY